MSSSDVRRDLAGGDDGQAGHGGLAHDGFERGLAGDEVRHTACARQAEFLVDVALAHVGIDDDDALAALRQHRAQVLGDEALAHVRRRAGDEHRAAVCAQQREVQGGAQAAQALHRVVVGVAGGEQLARALAARLTRRSSSASALLSGTVAYTGSDSWRSMASGSSTTTRSARMAHTRPRLARPPSTPDSSTMSALRGAMGNCAVTASSMTRTSPTVPARDTAQPLGAVEQVEVQRGGHLHVAVQAQRGLLRRAGGRRPCPACRAARAGARSANPPPAPGVFGGEALAQLVAFLLQDDDVLIHLDYRSEHGLGLHGQVDGAAGLAVVVVGGLGGVELALELGSCSSRNLSVDSASAERYSTFWRT